MVSLKSRRLAMNAVREKFDGLSIRSGLRLLGLHQSTFFYKPKRKRSDEELREKLTELAGDNSECGRPWMVWRLRERLGFKDNHKRIARVYRELGLQLGKRSRKKKKSERRFMFIAPKKPNELWAMDFVLDTFANGRRFRVLTVKDLFTHDAVVLHVDRSITGQDVANALDQLKHTRGLPEAIVCDNGPEFICRALDEWAFSNKIELRFIQPGKPIQNAFIESFNGKFRRECLDQNWFEDLEDAKKIIAAWRVRYNTDRPTKPLGMRTPAEFAKDYGIVI